MASRISFENKTGYKLKIEYDGEIYNLECTQRVLIPLNEYESKQFRISIDEEYYFNRFMFGSVLIRHRTGAKYRAKYPCYVAKFDMVFYDKDITTRKVEIKQHIRRVNFDVVFPLLYLDVQMPLKYCFSDKKQKRRFRTIYSLYQMPFYFFEFMLAVGALGAAFFTEFEAVNIFLGLFGVGCLVLFIKSMKKWYKIINFGKYSEDVLVSDSDVCMPIKISKRTIIFDDEE